MIVPHFGKSNCGWGRWFYWNRIWWREIHWTPFVYAWTHRHRERSYAKYLADHRDDPPKCKGCSLCDPEEYTGTLPPATVFWCGAWLASAILAILALLSLLLHG